MDGCLSKPIGADELLGAVAASLAGSRPTAGSTALQPEASRTVIVDLDAASRRLDGRDELLARLVEQFLAGVGPMIERIQAAARDRDPRELGLASHRLKGQAGTFGASAVVQSAGRLESLADRAEWEPIGLELAELEAAIPAMEHALADYLAAQTRAH